MLTMNAEDSTEQASVTDSSSQTLMNETARESAATGEARGRWTRLLRIEWLGQTVASLCWIASVLTYGISAAGDWLQLIAASSWLLANLAAVNGVEAD